MKGYHSPDSKVHVDNMGPTWVLSAPDGPHVGPMNLAITEVTKNFFSQPVLHTISYGIIRPLWIDLPFNPVIIYAMKQPFTVAPSDLFWSMYTLE